MKYRWTPKHQHMKAGMCSDEYYCKHWRRKILSGPRVLTELDRSHHIWHYTFPCGRRQCMSTVFVTKKRREGKLRHRVN